MEFLIGLSQVDNPFDHRDHAEDQMRYEQQNPRNQKADRIGEKEDQARSREAEVEFVNPQPSQENGKEARRGFVL